MARCRLLFLAALLAAWSPVFGQEPTTAEQADSRTANTTQAAESEPMMSLMSTLPNYSGDLWSRDALSGDWGGTRTELAENGIIFEFDLTQVIQGNAYGGKDTDKGFRYSGSVDYSLKLDTARMGLWPAGLLYIKGETMFGKGINGPEQLA